MCGRAEHHGARHGERGSGHRELGQGHDHLPGFQPLHLAVEEGEIFGFLGPNGAGKTTTLKMLMGLVFPTAGSARISSTAIAEVLPIR